MPDCGFISNASSAKLADSHLTADTHIYHVTTTAAKDSLHSMCGIEALLPIFSLLDELRDSPTRAAEDSVPRLGRLDPFAPSRKTCQ